MTAADPARGPGRPPRDIPRRNVVVRFEAADLALIDHMRGSSVSREQWIRAACMAATRVAGTA
jgi:hypothetical protein